MSDSAWRTWLRPPFRDRALASFFANVPAVEQHLMALTLEKIEPALEACNQDVWKLPVSVMRTCLRMQHVARVNDDCKKLWAFPMSVSRRQCQGLRSGRRN